MLLQSSALLSSPTAMPTATPYEGEEIAAFALQFEGYDYNYGGSSPETGFDCSGLVYYTYRQFGYRISRVASYQAQDGESVETLEDLLPGDIICFSWHNSNYINHAGLYIGDGNFIHAMDSAHDVVITSLAEYLETHDWYGRRIIGVVEKKSLAQIEAEEQQEWQQQWRTAQEAAAAATDTPQPTVYTPPPSTIPVPETQSAEEAEEAHRQEIEQAWKDIWATPTPDSPSASPAADAPAVIPTTSEEPSEPGAADASVVDSSSVSETNDNTSESDTTDSSGSGSEDNAEPRPDTGSASGSISESEVASSTTLESA